MITAFGPYRLTWFKVWTELVDPALPESAFATLLETRPDTEALVYPISSARLPAPTSAPAPA